MARVRILTVFTDPELMVSSNLEKKFTKATTRTHPQHHTHTSHKYAQPQPTMPAPAYIISRTLDPLFALVIGIGAAATRISREEKEMGRSTKETVDAGFRYVSHFSAEPFWRR